MMLWILVTALVFALFGFITVADKIILTRYWQNPVDYIMAIGLYTGVVSILAIFAMGLSTPISFAIFSLCAGIVQALTVFAYFYLAKTMDISAVIPLTQTYPVFVTISALFFLGESFSIIQYTGILVLVGAAVLLSMDPEKLRVYLNYKQLIVLSLILCGFTIQYIVKKWILYSINPYSVFAWGELGVALTALTLYFLSNRHIHLLSLFREKSKKFILAYSGMQASAIILILALTWLMSKTPISIFSALSAFQSASNFIIAAILSKFVGIIKENITRAFLITRFSAITLLFIGLYLLG